MKLNKYKTKPGLEKNMYMLSLTVQCLTKVKSHTIHFHRLEYDKTDEKISQNGSKAYYFILN